MHTASNNFLPETAEPSQRPYQIAGVVLAFLPLVSFLGQFFFSLRAGTSQIMLHHPTVIIADWIFVPFNFFVVRVIEWKQMKKLWVIAFISVVLNLLTLLFWQYSNSDSGHMISKSGAILPAGWVHFGFSIVETVLLMAFVFCRRANAKEISIVTTFSVIYFVAMGICGYILHNGFIVSDVITFVFGLFFILVYPLICNGSRKFF
jgi:hypothetical protein